MNWIYSFQVKTWFQNRRMKVKRIVKDPTDSTVVSYLRPDSTQGNHLAFRNLSEYMQHQFHPLPKHCPSAAQAWPCPESMCPAMGSLQSTLIKSALQYTNRSVKFSIALSSQPEPELGPQSVTSSSPDQQFLRPRAFPQSGHLHPGASGTGLYHGAPQPGLHHGAGLLHHGSLQSGHLHPRASGNGLQHRAPGTGLQHGAGLQHRAPGTGPHYGAGLHHEASQFGYLHTGASGNGLHPGATVTGHLHPGPQPEAQSSVLLRYQAAGGQCEGRGFS
ncbi:uncharacterized protein LOC129716161 [Leucoraja erinacea]|uniref:uncharacterized protein LOC129716161 n=1 Tax=Leucoraja erinaceus TaxID=7782 RepID=UPI002455393C|nr:uncharacterized protein LOC129716161 [Leucoraja erinacea]